MMMIDDVSGHMSRMTRDEASGMSRSGQMLATWSSTVMSGGTFYVAGTRPCVTLLGAKRTSWLRRLPVHVEICRVRCRSSWKVRLVFASWRCAECGRVLPSVCICKFRTTVGSACSNSTVKRRRSVQSFKDSRVSRELTQRWTFQCEFSASDWKATLRRVLQQGRSSLRRLLRVADKEQWEQQAEQNAARMLADA